MSLPVRFRRVAEADYDDALDYHTRVSPVVGRQFEAAVSAALADIGANPYRFAEALPGTREAPVPGSGTRFTTTSYRREWKCSASSTRPATPPSGSRGRDGGRHFFVGGAGLSLAAFSARARSQNAATMTAPAGASDAGATSRP